MLLFSRPPSSGRFLRRLFESVRFGPDWSQSPARVFACPIILVGLALIGVGSLAAPILAREAERHEVADLTLLVRLRQRFELIAGPEPGLPILLADAPGIDTLHGRLGIKRICYLFPEGGSKTSSPSFERLGLDRILQVIVPPPVDSEATLALYRALPEVDWVEVDRRRASTGIPDPRVPDQWFLQDSEDHDIDGELAWEISKGIPEVVVAILDTGVDFHHPDLLGKSTPGYDFANEDPDPMDDEGHGTFVAGLVAGNLGNGIDGAGVSPGVSLCPIKVLGASGSGRVSDSVRGIVFAVETGADVLNMSYGGAFSQAEADALAYAHEAGSLLVASAGNDGGEGLLYPAALPTVISVGATDRLDRRAVGFPGGGGSNFGESLDLVAPGELILSCRLGGGMVSYSGTSASAPIVSGICALLRSLDSSLGPEEIRGLLREGAEDEVGRPEEDLPGDDWFHGAGRVNARESLLLAFPVVDPKLEVTPRGNILPGETLEFSVRGWPAAAPFALAVDTRSGAFSVRGVTLGLQGPSSDGFEVLWRLRDQPLSPAGESSVRFSVPSQLTPGSPILFQGGVLVGGRDFVVTPRQEFVVE